MTLIDKIQANRELWEKRTPCFVVNKSTIVDRLSEFSHLFDGKIAYSTKTNPAEQIVRLIQESNHNFMVCSTEELDYLQQIVGDVSGVVYLSPTLDKEELEYILQRGIHRLSLDSPQQVKLVCSNPESFQEVFIRVATGYKIKKEDFTYEKNSFLGIPIDEALSYLTILSSRGINVGVHNQLSSQNTDLESWQQNLAILTELVQEAKTRAIPLYSINLGGGFPISYTDSVPTLRNIAGVISQAQQQMRTFYPNLNLIFEPGRYIVGESIALVTRVRQKKKFRDKLVLIVDASTYNSSMDTMLVGINLPCVVIHDIHGGLTSEEHYIIRGRSPCSLDIFRKNVALPQAEVGDYIVFLNAGAYNFASDFVSMKKPETILI